MEKYFPILGWARRYKASDLRGDVVASLTVAVMLIPQGMAVAMLAGLPPIIGLYASVVPLFLYSIFGSSRQLHVGPVALVSLLVASGISDLADPGTQEYVGYATLLAAMVGAILITMGAARFGFFVDFLSQPVISGFTSAAAVIIMLSQLKNLLGVSTSQKLYSHQSLLHYFDDVPPVNIPTVIIGATSLLLLLWLRRWKATFPRALVVVVLGTLAVRLFDLQSRGVDVLGDVPGGIHGFAIPTFELGALRVLFPIAIGIALVGFMESIAVAKKFAREYGYEVDANQELIALGAANLGASTFGAYPVTGSFARTAVNAQAGAKSGLASILTSVVVAITLWFLTDLFYYLPTAALAAIIIGAVSMLIDVKEVKHLYRVKHMDLASLIVTFFATLILGIELGLLVSIGVSAILLVKRTTRPHYAILGRLPGTKIYRNIERYPEAQTLKGVSLIRFDGSLYFANASFLKEVIVEHASTYKGELKAIVFDMSSINDIDSSADTALHEAVEDLEAKGVKFLFTNVKGPVRDVLKRSGLYHQLGEDHFFFRNHDAIEHVLGNGGHLLHEIPSGGGGKRRFFR